MAISKQNRQHPFGGCAGFGYGSSNYEPDPEPMPDMLKFKDTCCSKESCGCGCYVAQIDFEQLDQQ